MKLEDMVESEDEKGESGRRNDMETCLLHLIGKR